MHDLVALFIHDKCGLCRRRWRVGTRSWRGSWRRYRSLRRRDLDGRLRRRNRSCGCWNRRWFRNDERRGSQGHRWRHDDLYRSQLGRFRDGLWWFSDRCGSRDRGNHRGAVVFLRSNSSSCCVTASGVGRSSFRGLRPSTTAAPAFFSAATGAGVAAGETGPGASGAGGGGGGGAT